MADHSELIAELSAIEKMPTGERLKHAKKKRSLQLKKFQQYEKQLEKELNKKARKSVVVVEKMSVARPAGKSKKYCKVRFISNIILLEAAGRNDIQEGMWPLCLLLKKCYDKI